MTPACGATVAAESVSRFRRFRKLYSVLIRDVFREPNLGAINGALDGGDGRSAALHEKRHDGCCICSTSARLVSPRRTTQRRTYRQDASYRQRRRPPAECYGK
jgi:hypothetical protein